MGREKRGRGGKEERGERERRERRLREARERVKEGGSEVRQREK